MTLSPRSDRSMQALAGKAARHAPGASTNASAGMMPDITKGRFRVRAVAGAPDMQAALDLRAQVFRGSSAAADADPLDARCDHMLIEDRTSGTVVCAFRILILPSGAALPDSYSAQFYDLSALQAFGGSMLELGRFCLHPDWHDPDILRLAWGALASVVDARHVAMLFGCSSFAGTDPAPFARAFSMLHARHAAPEVWRPGIKAPEVVPLQRAAAQNVPQKPLPALLRTYLMMGGWVSDHAVIDRQLNTLHVFTGVEIARIPPARKRLLRAIAS